MLDIKAVLSELSTMAGPSGFEHEVARRVSDLMRPYVDEVNTDALSNVFGIKRSKKDGAKKLLMSAHIDEIGLMVTKIEDGFLRFRTIGGIDPRVLPAREIKVLAELPMYGVVGALPPHLQTRDEMKSPLPLEKLSIDVGLSQEEAERLVPIGTPAVFVEKTVELGEQLFSGKALDDRACFVMLLRMLELLKDEELSVDLVVLASSQEEVGTRGATVGAFRHDPDYAVAVDVTHGQTPDAPKEGTFKIGEGVPITMGPNITRKLSDRLIKLAKANEIPWHPEVAEGRTGTDAWPMQVTRKGVATALVSLPLKYMHTPCEVISIEDLENGAKLLSEFVKSLERGEE
jgi:putative aminopeptidase FrvX